MKIRILNPKRKPQKKVKTMARKRKKSTRRKIRRRRNPVAIPSLVAGNPRRRRRYKRNPAKLNVKGILGNIQPMAIGAGTAIAVNFGFSKLTMIQEKWKPYIKLGLAILLPTIIKKGALKDPVKYGSLVIGAMGIKDLIVNAVPALAGDDLTPEEVEALEEYAAQELEGTDDLMVGTNVVYGEDDLDDDSLMGTNVVFGDEDDLSDFE